MHKENQMNQWWRRQFEKLKNWWNTSVEDEYHTPSVMKWINLTAAISKIDEEYPIRFARASDLPKLVVLQKQAYHGFIAWGLPQLKKDWYQNPYAVYLIIEIESKIVGAIFGRMRAKTSHISHLMVVPEYQQKGIGRMMLKVWENIMMQQDVQKITLEVSERNDGAIAFYHTMGFQCVKKTPHYYRYSEAALIMEKAIFGQSDKKEGNNDEL